MLSSQAFASEQRSLDELLKTVDENLKPASTGQVPPQGEKKAKRAREGKTFIQQVDSPLEVKSDLDPRERTAALSRPELFEWSAPNALSEKTQRSFANSLTVGVGVERQGTSGGHIKQEDSNYKSSETNTHPQLQVFINRYLGEDEDVNHPSKPLAFRFGLFHRLAFARFGVSRTASGLNEGRVQTNISDFGLSIAPGLSVNLKQSWKLDFGFGPVFLLRYQEGPTNLSSGSAFYWGDHLGFQAKRSFDYSLSVGLAVHIQSLFVRDDSRAPSGQSLALVVDKGL